MKHKIICAGISVLLACTMLCGCSDLVAISEYAAGTALSQNNTGNNAAGTGSGSDTSRSRASGTASGGSSSDETDGSDESQENGTALTLTGDWYGERGVVLASAVMPAGTGNDSGSAADGSSGSETGSSSGGSGSDGANAADAGASAASPSSGSDSGTAASGTDASPAPSDGETAAGNASGAQTGTEGGTEADTAPAEEAAGEPYSTVLSINRDHTWAACVNGRPSQGNWRPSSDNPNRIILTITYGGPEATTEWTLERHGDGKCYFEYMNPENVEITVTKMDDEKPSQLFGDWNGLEDPASEEEADEAGSTASTSETDLSEEGSLSVNSDGSWSSSVNGVTNDGNWHYIADSGHLVLLVVEYEAGYASADTFAFVKKGDGNYYFEYDPSSAGTGTGTAGIAAEIPMKALTGK